jgi:hypothetical protein
MVFFLFSQILEMFEPQKWSDLVAATGVARRGLDAKGAELGTRHGARRQSACATTGAIAGACTAVEEAVW